MKFVKYLANLGYGSRREVERMFKYAEVTDRDGNVFEPMWMDPAAVQG